MSDDQLARPAAAAITAHQHSGPVVCSFAQEALWVVEKLTLIKDMKDAHSDTVFGIEFSDDGAHLVAELPDLVEIEAGALIPGEGFA